MKKAKIVLLLLLSGTMMTTRPEQESFFSPVIKIFTSLNISDNIDTIKITIQNYASSIGTTSTSYAQHVKNFCLQHKYKLIGAGVLGIYSYAMYKILGGNSYLARKDLWSLWERKKKNQDLALLPQDELALQLMAEIQRRHIDIEDPADFLSPVGQFMRNAQNELCHLRSYKSFYKFAKNLSLATILPFEKKRWSQIQERIDRLTYIKNCAATWLAQYKMVVNMPENW